MAQKGNDRMSIHDIDNFTPALREFARNSSFVLEIGVDTGDGSTLAFTEGMEQRGGEDRLFVSVDILPDYILHRPQVPYWHFVVGDSRAVDTLLQVSGISHGRKADLIFIDTHHTPEQISKELVVWQHMAKPSTTWLFHDTYMMGQYNVMTDAIKEFASTHGWIYEDYSTEGHGLGMMRYACAQCSRKTGKRHAEEDWNNHPWKGHGYTKESGWTKTDDERSDAGEEPAAVNKAGA